MSEQERLVEKLITYVVEEFDRCITDLNLQEWLKTRTVSFEFDANSSNATVTVKQKEDSNGRQHKQS